MLWFLVLFTRGCGKGLSDGCTAAEQGEALHTHVPIFKDSMDASAVHLSTLAEWLADSIFDEQEPAGNFSEYLGTLVHLTLTALRRV